MILVNIDSIPGKELEVLGPVQGTQCIRRKELDVPIIIPVVMSIFIIGFAIVVFLSQITLKKKIICGIVCFVLLIVVIAIYSATLASKARTLATQRMVFQAEKLKADAIINVRYTSATDTSKAAPAVNVANEIIAYGTAVKFKS